MESDVRFYLKMLQEHHFVLTPRGNGMDTHRLWETLYMGSTPIVEHSALDTRLLSKLPVLIVDNFANVTPAFLNSPHALALRRVENFINATNSLLSMSYWRQIITGKEVI